jgi:sporulation protein YlmC with PRC-barrel domain
MRKFMITTVSTLALAIAGAGFAAAQDRSAPPQSITPGSPAAGAIKKSDTMQNDPAMQQRQTTEPRSGGSGSMDRSRDADRTGAADSSTFKSYSANKPAGAAVSGGLSADKLIGTNIYDPSGSEIGEVKDLVVDSDNRINKAIVEVGGFLGVGSKYVAVDIAQLKQSGKKKGFVTSMTKEELKTLPEYKTQSGNWVRSYTSGG